MEEIEMTKKLLTFILASGLAISLVYGIALAGNGNGLPPGPRYMLNVIAYDKDNCPAGDFTGSNRHMIAVEADFNAVDLGATQAGADKNVMVKQNTIKLTQGDHFQVLDGNACGSKQGAEFILPADPYNCTLGDGTVVTDDPACTGEDLSFQEYNVFIRLVGAKGTGVGITTCADEAVDLDGDGVIEDTILCSTENVVRMRAKGKVAKFENVTRQLLTLCLDTDGDTVCDARYPLFADELEDYFWQWNTKGKAHAQLVFIPIPD